MSVGVGLGVLSEMMEAELDDVVGAKHATIAVSQADFDGDSVAWIRPRGKRAFCDAKRKEVPTRPA